MVNRGALLLRYKKPAVDWVNSADPYPGHILTLQEANEERPVYLISDEAGDTKESFDRWLKRNFSALFEMELNAWYTDPKLWPKQRTFKMFQEWFDVELHTLLLDLVGDDIYDDEN